MNSPYLKLGISLIIAHILRLIFSPNMGGFVGILLHAFMMVTIFGLFYIPWFKTFDFLKTIRDCAVVFIANIIIICSSYILYSHMMQTSSPPLIILAVTASVSTTLSFLIIGCYTKSKRLSHMSNVALIVWLSAGIQVLIEINKWKPWLLSFFLFFIGMWIGYYISILIKKPIDVT